MARICFLTERLLRGWGVDHVVHRVADGLGGLGHDVEVVCLRADRRYGDGRYRVRLLDVPFHPPETLEARVLARCDIVRQRPYDLYVAAMFPFFAVASRLGLPFVYFEFGVVDPVGIDPRMARLLAGIRRAGQTYQLRARRVAAISHFLVGEQVNRAKHAETDVVYLGADSYGPVPSGAAVAAFRNGLGFDPDAEVVGYVGRIERGTYKGVDELVEIVDAVRERRPRVRLLLAGHCDEPTAARFAAVPGVVVRPHVPAEEMATVFAACDIVASASCWEGFNLPLAEAQFYARPVVAYARGAHPEIVAPSGATVRTRGEFIDALTELCADPAARVRRGETARAFARRFTWAETVRSMAACLAAAGLPTLANPPAAELQPVVARLERLGFPSHGRAALHIGCGSGDVTQALAERWVEVVGLDAAPERIEEANGRNRFPRRCRYGVNGPLHLGVVGERRFDFILGTAMERRGFPVALDLVRECIRVLSPGGIAVFRLPSSELRPAAISEIVRANGGTLLDVDGAGEGAWYTVAQGRVAAEDARRVG